MSKRDNDRYNCQCDLAKIAVQNRIAAQIDAFYAAPQDYTLQDTISIIGLTKAIDLYKAGKLKA